MRNRTAYIREIKKENNVYCFYIYKDRFKFLDLIYQDNKICLSRKYKSYKESEESFKGRVYIVKNTILDVYKSGIFYKRFNSIKECSLGINIPGPTICNAMRENKVTRGYSFVKIKSVKNKIKVENNADLS